MTFAHSYASLQWRFGLGSMAKALKKAIVDPKAFNKAAVLPYNLRLDDFKAAMQDVYDFLSDTNQFLVDKGLPRLDETLRPANMSGFLSDMLTDSVAKHSRSLVRNMFHNGHPDLLVNGVYANNAVQAGTKGVEIKSTRHAKGSVDFHGGRDQTLCVFVYRVDSVGQPTIARDPLEFNGIFMSSVKIADFKRYERGDLGTRTSSLNKQARAKLQEGWIYRKGS
jgi:hypothetical protein